MISQLWLVQSYQRFAAKTGKLPRGQRWARSTISSNALMVGESSEAKRDTALAT
jgi:hypothetical protein